MCPSAAALRPRWHPRLRIRNVVLSACSGWDSPGVSLAGIPAGGDGDGVRGRHSPCWGRHLGASSPLRGFSGRKPCPPRTSDGGAFGVVTSLEASFSETDLGLWQCRVVVTMGGFCRWRGKAAGADGWLEGGCSAFVAVAKFTPAGRRLCTGVGSFCLQRTTAAIVAWQLPVRCGTASEDGARNIDTVGRLGLQRTAAGCSASLSDSGAVHRQKTVRTITCFAGMMAAAVCGSGAT